MAIDRYSTDGATTVVALLNQARLVFQKPVLVGLNPILVLPKPLPSVGKSRRCSHLSGSTRDDVRAVERV